MGVGMVLGCSFEVLLMAFKRALVDLWVGRCNRVSFLVFHCFADELGRLNGTLIPSRNFALLLIRPCPSGCRSLTIVLRVNRIPV